LASSVAARQGHTETPDAFAPVDGDDALRTLIADILSVAKYDVDTAA
jgi:hypothetical protein